MKILIVTSWHTHGCGIEEHSKLLIEYATRANPALRFLPGNVTHHPEVIREMATVDDVDVVHLNYHAALHSRWGVDEITRLQDDGHKVIVTYHDTGVPNSEQCRAICAAADVAIVHEPFDDLHGDIRYWRMGVPERTSDGMHFGTASRLSSQWQQDRGIEFLRYPGQPVLGSIGFPFPWKNFDLLLKVTASLGWACLLITPTASPEQLHAWRALNPDCYLNPHFLTQPQVTGLLAGCDATAFPYVTHNTGQSGAILQGIAARKPVLAFSTCRQFRALYEDEIGRRAIRWAETVGDLTRHLLYLNPVRYDPGIVALAQQDSWVGLGMKYADLYQEVAGGDPAE